jgi:mercuric reductase
VLTLSSADGDSELTLSMPLTVAAGALVAGCCVGAAVVVGQLSGFPLLVFAGCACILAVVAVVAFVAYRRQRDVTRSDSTAVLEAVPSRGGELDGHAERATSGIRGAPPGATAGGSNGTAYRGEGVAEPRLPGSEANRRFKYDLAVIGSGGGAFAAAIAARRRELSVVMVEEAGFGGTCVNVGCIPSKALLAAADTRHRAGDRRFPGVSTEAGSVDFSALIAGKDEIVQAMRQDKYIDLAYEYGIEQVEGRARFVGGPSLEVDGRRIEAAHYLIATGAEPHVPDIRGLDDSGYLTSSTAMELDRLPASLLVLGGGYVAMEMAQLFSHLGTTVTMLVRSQLARREEPEIADAIRNAFVAEGIAVVEGAQATEARRDGDQVVVTTRNDGEFRAEQLLVAAGRRPRTRGLRLEQVGVELGGADEVLVDAGMSTRHPRIWAAGDVTGHPQFVYVAAKQGAIAVENAFQVSRRRIDYSALPRIVFTDPTSASAGVTEAQARELGIDCECRVLDLENVPRARVGRHTPGVVKLVAERESGRVIGVHLFAEGAGNAILAGVYAIEAGRTVADMAEGWDPYLTIGEAIHLAAVAFTRDPSKLSCCAA